MNKNNLITVFDPDDLKTMYDFNYYVKAYTGATSSQVNTIYLLFFKYLIDFKVGINTKESEKLLLEIKKSLNENLDQELLKQYLHLILFEYDEIINFSGIVYNILNDIGLGNQKLWKKFNDFKINNINLLIYFIDELLISTNSINISSIVNKSIVDLCLSISNIKENDICYNPMCGTANFLTNINKNCYLYGDDVNINELSIAFIKKIIMGKDIDFRFEDCYLSYMAKKNFADVVFIQPLFCSINDNCKLIYKDYPTLLPSKAVDVSSILLVINSLKENGIGFLHIPIGFLFRNMKDAAIVKKFLLEKNYLDAVIEFKNICNGTGVSTALLILKKNKKDGNIIFVNASKYCIKSFNRYIIPNDAISNIVDIINKKKNINGFSAVCESKEILKNNDDYNFITNRFIKYNPIFDYRNISNIDKDIDNVWKLIKENMEH